MNLQKQLPIFDFDLETAGFLSDQRSTVTRRLSEMRGYYLDGDAFESLIASAHDPVVYTVSNLEHWHGAGDLHIGIGCINPGQVGSEYFMTKGHLHQWREAAEIYIGLRGEGMMLLEDERDGTNQACPLAPNQVVYVPGYAAHRTINTGNVPLVYIGIFAATAGHDYGTIATENFRQIVIQRDGVTVVMLRRDYQNSLSAE